MSAAQNITLRDIEQSISGLLEILEDPAITEEERAVAQDQLVHWIGEELSKVDRVRGFIRHCIAMGSSAESTAKEYTARARLWDERKCRLSDLCMLVMEERGVKKLEGAGGLLRIQINGGKQALTISDEKLIPDEFRVMRITAPVKLLQWLPLQKLQAAGARVSYEIDEQKVRTALAEPCPACTGIISLDTTIDNCPACGGSGKAGVPGAHLEPRGSHLRLD